MAGSVSSNKAQQYYAAGGRRTPFTLRLRLHSKGTVVRWRYTPIEQRMIF
jgi:hypothetical protein|tara:strand:- start:2478 stop:2627 length:150 start_codon:yes stop_codon:yes gene_type:complete